MRWLFLVAICACLLTVSILGLAPAPVRAQSVTSWEAPYQPSETTSVGSTAVQSAASSTASEMTAAPQHTVGRHGNVAEHATPVVGSRGPIDAVPVPKERHPDRRLPPPPPLPPESGRATEPAASVATPAGPTKPSGPEGSVGTGLPLPRFAALRTDDVNLRAGPGFRYPIDWVYKRRGLPMEIEREFEVWRLVKGPDGTRGWVHEATLTGRRTFMIQGSNATLLVDPRDGAAPVAVLKVGVIGLVRSCNAGSDWCRVLVGTYRGFLKRSQIWGVLPDEVIAP